MLSSRSFVAILFLVCGAPPSYSAPAQTIVQLIDVIAPAKQEQEWQSIPWETDLAEARRKAAAQNKPIFLWEMDGHPLGCT